MDQILFPYDRKSGTRDVTTSRTLNGRQFTAGPLAVLRQHEEFLESGALKNGDGFTYLPLSPTTPMPLTFQTWLCVQRSHVKLRDESHMASTSSQEELAAWYELTPVGGIRNAFENTMEDIAIRPVFLVSLRRGCNYKFLPVECPVDWGGEPLKSFRDELITNPDTFITWFSGMIKDFMLTAFGERVTAEDLVISSSIDVMRSHTSHVLDPERDMGFHAHKITIRHLVLPDAGARTAFQRAVRAYFGGMCGTLVDMSAYAPNANIILAGSSYLRGTLHWSETHFTGEATEGAATLVPPGARAIVMPVVDVKISAHQEAIISVFKARFDPPEFHWREDGPTGVVGVCPGWACPFDAHCGAPIRLRCRGGQVTLTCLGKPRPFNMLRRRGGGTVPALRTMTTACGQIPLGGLPYVPFAHKPDAVLPSLNGKWMDARGIPPDVDAVMRCPLGAGKTTAAKGKVATVFEGRREARVVYASGLIQTVAAIQEDFNEFLSQRGLPKIPFYRDVERMRLSGSVAVNVMSAGDVETGVPIDLLVWDEVETSLPQMVTLATHKESPLVAMIRLMSNARRVIYADADADESTLMAANLSGKKPLVFDTDATPFRGTTVEIHACFLGTSFVTHCMLTQMVDIIGTAKWGVVVPCTTVVDVDLVTVLLAGRREYAVHTCTGPDDDNARNKFMHLFTGAPPDDGLIHVFVHSPVIGPAVSNTWCDVVCVLTRTRTQSLHAHNQAIWRARRAVHIHIFPMEEGILRSGLLQPVGIDVEDSDAIPVHLRLDVGSDIPGFVALQQLRGKPLPECFYSTPKDGVARRWHLENPRPLMTFREACRQACVGVANEAVRGKGGAFDVRLHEAADSIPEDWRLVKNVATAEPWLRARAIQEQRNRQRLILPHIIAAARRGGAVVEPITPRLVDFETSKAARELVANARFAAACLRCLRVAEGFNMHVRPHLVDGLPSDVLIRAFVSAAQEKPGPPKKLPDDFCAEFGFLAMSDAPLARVLVDTISGSEDVGDDEELSAVTMWMAPIISVGGGIVASAVDGVMAAVTKCLRDIDGEDAVKLRKPATSAMRCLVHLLDSRALELVRLKRLFLLGEDAKTVPQRTTLSRMSALDAFFRVATEDGRGIIGIGGATLRHVCTDVGVVAARFADGSAEIKRTEAFRVLSDRFPMATKPERPKCFLQAALNEVPGASYSVKGDSTKARPTLEIVADWMTVAVDDALAKSSSGDHRRIVDLWASVWGNKRRREDEDAGMKHKKPTYVELQELCRRNLLPCQGKKSELEERLRRAGCLS